MRFVSTALVPAAMICLSAATAHAGSPMAVETSTPLFKSSATESMTVIRDPQTGLGLTTQVSVNYHQLSGTMPHERDLIARETITSGYSEAAEGESALAKVDLFYRHKDHSYSPKPDHSVTVAEATEVLYDQDHWVAIIHGCCDAEPILQLFAYGSDKPFLYSNSKYAQINLPNARVNRFVGTILRSQAPMDQLDRAIFGKDKKAIAAILYASPEKPLQKLLLYAKTGAKEENIPYHTDSIKLKSKSPKDEDGYNNNANISQTLTMWSQDTLPDKPAPSAVSGFSITVKFAGNGDKPETVTIPVDNDKFGEAKLSGQTLTTTAE